MKIVITTKKPVLVPGGRLPAGVPVDVAPSLGKMFIERGDAVAFEVKESQDRPYQADGAEASLSALPAGQASQPMIANESESGAKRRGRPRKA